MLSIAHLVRTAVLLLGTPALVPQVLTLLVVSAQLALLESTVLLNHLTGTSVLLEPTQLPKAASRSAIAPKSLLMILRQSMVKPPHPLIIL